MQTAKGIAVLLAAMSMLRTTPGKTDTVRDPLAEGPYPVGVATTVLVDTSRTDALTRRPRQLVTEIWYPAANSARKLPLSRVSDFFPGGITPEVKAYLTKTLGKAADDMDGSYRMSSHRDAPVRSGKYPLIIFSHGNGGFRYQNTFWCDYVASHGYIVVSADHTGNAGITILKEGVVPFQASEMAHSALDRTKDVSFLLDQMILWNSGADPRFKGKIELSRPCAAGMSFGSMTAVKVGDTDSRFKCVIAMSGAFPEHSNLKIPTLWMIGSEDRTIGAAGNAIVRGHHNKQLGPSYLLELRNGGHYSFTDIMKLRPDFGDGAGKGKRRDSGVDFDFTSMDTTYKIVNSYSVAFLGAYVKGQKGYLAYLSKNGWPDELIWDTGHTTVR